MLKMHLCLVMALCIHVERYVERCGIGKQLFFGTAFQRIDAVFIFSGIYPHPTLLQVFAKDAASSLVVHDKFVAIGTQTGYIYILDHLGNLHSESVCLYFVVVVAFR